MRLALSLRVWRRRTRVTFCASTPTSCPTCHSDMAYQQCQLLSSSSMAALWIRSRALTQRASSASLSNTLPHLRSAGVVIPYPDPRPHIRAETHQACQPLTSLHGLAPSTHCRSSFSWYMGSTSSISDGQGVLGPGRLLLQVAFPVPIVSNCGKDWLPSFVLLKVRAEEEMLRGAHRHDPPQIQRLASV